MMELAGFTVSLMMIMVIISPRIYGKELPDQQEIEVQQLLKRLNKPALKSIKSEDGEIIDCVPITTQPALDHPLLKNHTIKMKPSFIPEGYNSTNTKKDAKAITQVWQKNGNCPENTVAIRRTKREDILRAKSIESFGKKTQQSIPGGHEHAAMDSGNGRFYGTQFALNMWRPEVEVPLEFSLAQTWLVSESENVLNTIEAGWQVFPAKYDDNNLRLFVFWTGNAYQPGPGQGCYNNDCPGFVQMSNSINVGGSIAPVSQYDGEQYELPMLIWKSDDNWWLKIGDEIVGYNVNGNGNCYNVKPGDGGTSFGTHFFFGGPGRNDNCP